MNVSVRYYGQLAEIAESEEEHYQFEHGAKVRDLLSDVHRKHPEAGTVAITVALNDQFSGEETALHEGDRVDLFPPFAGG